MMVFLCWRSWWAEHARLLILSLMSINDGYGNLMKKLRRFLIFVMKEYWKLFCSAVSIIFYSYMAGVGFLAGAATLYLYMLKV